MLIGAPFEHYGRRRYAGSAYVVYGKKTTTTVTLRNLGTAGYRIVGTRKDVLGWEVAGAGDLGNDEIPDMLLSSGHKNKAFTVRGRL